MYALTGHRVVVVPEDIERFNGTWPCSKIPMFDPIVFEFSSSGDLVDVTLLTMETVPDPVDRIRDSDGPEWVALATDAQAFCWAHRNDSTLRTSPYVVHCEQCAEDGHRKTATVYYGASETRDNGGVSFFNGFHCDEHSRDAQDFCQGGDTHTYSSEPAYQGYAHLDDMGCACVLCRAETDAHAAEQRPAA